MTRNTVRRVEVAAPIYDEAIKKRIRGMFNIMLSDNVKGRRMKPNGNIAKTKSQAKQSIHRNTSLRKLMENIR